MLTHSQDVKTVLFHPTDDNLLASASYDDTIRLASDNPVADWESFQTLEGHGGTVWDLAFEPKEGRWLASAGDEGEIRFWERRCVVTLNNPSLFFSPIRITPPLLPQGLPPLSLCPCVLSSPTFISLLPCLNPPAVDSVSPDTSISAPSLSPEGRRPSHRGGRRPYSGTSTAGLSTLSRGSAIPPRHPPPLLKP